MSKPFIERLTLDNVNLKIIRENRQKISGFQLFKSSFLGQVWNNVKTNWLMLVFCLPVLAWIVYSQVDQILANTTIPYSGNLGIGYPIVNDAYVIGARIDFDLAMKKAMYMLPLIVIGSVGLAGVFNVVKYFCWGFKIKIVKTFFRGIKNSFAPFMWVGLMIGLCYVLLTFVFNVFNVYDVATGVRVMSYIGTILLCYFVLLISVFITTQASVFNLSLFEILKNSFFLGTKFILQNSMIAAIGIASMLLPLLTFNSIVQVIAYCLFFMMAFSYLATVWTIYGHYVYDMMYSEKPEKEAHRPKNPQPVQSSQKPKIVKSVEISANSDSSTQSLDIDTAEGNQNQVQKDKKPIKTYHNPKKKKKS